MSLNPEQVLQKRPEVHSPVVMEGRKVIITYRQKRTVMSATMMIVAGLLLIMCGSAIASWESTLATQSCLFAITPLCCIITGILTLAAGSAVPKTSVAKRALVYAILSVLLSFATIILYFLDTIYYRHYRDDSFTTILLSGICLILTSLELALSLHIAMSKKYSLKHITIVKPYALHGRENKQTLPKNQTPPTTKTPPTEAQAPPVVHKKPPNYNTTSF